MDIEPVRGGGSRVRVCNSEVQICCKFWNILREIAIKSAKTTIDKW